jgi:hypothetical protein
MEHDKGEKNNAKQMDVLRDWASGLDAVRF